MAHDDFQLYAEDLDDLVGQAKPPGTEGTASISLPSSCHGVQPVIAFYTEGTAQLYLLCSVCEKPMCALQLAHRPAAPDKPRDEPPSGGSVVQFRPRKK